LAAFLVVPLAGGAVSVRADDDDDDGHWKHKHRYHPPYYVAVPTVRTYTPPPVVYGPPPMVIYPPQYVPYEPAPPSINLNIPLR
jgi:hypothetical protein